ncbi:hypothetical protein DFH11DRAFT_1879938 [Phellopilus nigrolimitatus]|nr:hypothetical protein DFH11DRAFT_1879938 [Phellopilus nigrolimitatus]
MATRRRLHVVSSPSLSSCLPHCRAAALSPLAVGLEKKVAKVATTRCSTEEVQALQKELSEWMGVVKTIHGGDQQQHAAIQLSLLLLRAILMNHIVHSEAANVAKGVEQQLHSRLADGDLICEKLDSDLCQHKNLLAVKTQEVASLRSDLSKLKGSVVTPTPLRRPAPTATSPSPPRPPPSRALDVQPRLGRVPTGLLRAHHAHRWARACPGPGSSPMPFPGRPTGTSSASATVAALQHPASPSPASCAYHHTRSASMMQHRAMTPAPAVHAVLSASSTLSSGSRHGAMTLAAVRQRLSSTLKYTYDAKKTKQNGEELNEIVVLVVRHDEHDYVVVAGSAGSRRRVLMAMRSRVDHRRGQRRRSARGGEAGGDVEKPVPSGPLRALVDITKFSVFIGSINRSMGSKAQKDLTRCVTAPH